MSHLHPGNVPSHSSDSYDFSNLPFINLLDKDTSSVEVSAHPISKLPVLEVIELPAKEIQTYAVKLYKESVTLLKDPQSEDEIKRGIKSLKEAASYDYPLALFGLSYYYYYGKFTLAKNRHEAFELLEKAASYGLPDAQKALENFQLQKEHAYEHLFQQVHENDTESQYKLGYLYFKGDHIEQNYEQAFILLTKAARKSHPKALFCLGLLYHYGRGTVQNMRKAVRLYQQSAQLGDRKAQYNFALCCKKGAGLKKNPAQAFEYFLKAASQNYTPAQFSLALCYENGLGCDINLASAFFYYEIAASAGHISAQLNAGICCSKGQGTQINHQKALEWFQKAVNQGNEKALTALNELQTYLDKVNEASNVPPNPKPVPSQSSLKRKEQNPNSYPKRIRSWQ